MFTLSKRQREIMERDTHILKVARELLLERGYFGLTMDRVAQACEYPKGTVYQRFGCKEDIVVALATESMAKRTDMMRRGLAFKGRPRERVLALGEAVSLFSRLHPSDSQILHNANGPIRDKASADRVEMLDYGEAEALHMLVEILEEAQKAGDIQFDPERNSIERVAFGLWALVEGGLTLVEAGIAQNLLKIDNPFTSLFTAFNVLADGYGWRPLYAENNWEDVLAEIRRTVFPEEASAAYGEAEWYGDHR